MGFVGGTTAKVLEKVHEIISYDKYKPDYTSPDKLRDAEVVFVCVPTPMMASGEIDYSSIHDSLKTLESVMSDKKPLVVIRSTAVSGTTDSLTEQYSFRFVFNPEFLREKHALSDMNNTNRIVIGTNNEEDFQIVKKIYDPLFPNAKYIHVNAKTAEMIKYASNVMLAGQIALANEINQICGAVGVDYDSVKGVLLLDDRIAKNIDVPGHDGDFGFGGKCFPKDLNALIYLARENNYRPYLLEEVWRLNEKLRKNKDWLNIKGATSLNKYS